MSTSGEGLHFIDSTHVRMGRRRLVYFGGTGYLGLAFHPDVRAAMAKAAATGFLQSGASRATTGEQPTYRRVERRLARFFKVDEALLVSAGYLAPMAVVHGIRDGITHVLLEEGAHACVQDAALLAGRPVRQFRADEVDSLAGCLHELPATSRPLVACDGTRGLGGGVSPADHYLRALPARGWLLVDDAHGAGAVGPGGRGACALMKLNDPRVIQTVSLAKAFGVAGGAILGDRRRLAGIRGRASSFIGTTAPLLPAMAALEEAVDVISRSVLVPRLQENARRLYEGLPRRREVLSDACTPIAGVYPANRRQASRLHRTLQAAGIFPSFIEYLNTPPGGFLRLAVQAGHTVEEVQQLTQAVVEGLGGIRS